MSEPLTCVQFDEWSGELAFELLEPEHRDQLLAHASGCDRCRRELEALSATADLFVLLAPDGEPPIGFEQRVVAAMSGGPRRNRLWIGLVAAGLLFVIGLGIGSRRSSDAPSNVRQATLVDVAGRSVGSASITWTDDVVLTLALKNLEVGTYRCLIQRTDGTLVEIASWGIDETGAGAWAVPLDIPASSVRSVLLEEDDGARIASALLR